MPAYDDDSMLTKKQLASALNTSERTIERWLAAGTAPPTIKLPSGGLRWRWGSVRAWLVAQGDRPPGGRTAPDTCAGSNGPQNGS